MRHLIYVPPVRLSSGSPDDPIPASSLRLLGWPEESIPQANKDVEPTFLACSAEYGASRCPCGALVDLEWEA